MADFTSTSVPRPKDWQAFERKARLLFELSLNDSGTLNNGRSGQPQHGVDIYGKRGGRTGHYVGIQCKGKDVDFGGSVTKAELETEVANSRNFVPPLREFILITTANDDPKILEEARLLETKEQASGRNITVTVWGWQRIQQEIARFPEAIREFSPDGSPFTDQILSANAEVRKLVEQSGERTTTLLQTILERLPPPVATEASTPVDGVERHINDEIDGYRELTRKEQPRTALQLLGALKDRVWETASQKVRFRILSNLGAAYHALGEYDKAADYFLDAAELNPEDAKGLANRIAALLLKGRSSEAHTAAVNALSKFPDDPELAMQRLLALAPGESVEGVWASLADAARQKPESYVNRIVSLREAQDSTWHAVAQEALRINPADDRLRTLEAESVLDRTLSADPGAVGLATSTVPTQSELISAAATLEASWKSTLGRETPPQPAFGHNAALAKAILGDVGGAAAILDAVIATGRATEETKQLRISLYRKSGLVDDAIRVADTLVDSPLSRIVRADLRADKNPFEARKILAERGAFKEEREIVGAALTVIGTYCDERNFDDAMLEAEELKRALPKHPQGPLSVYRVKHQSGEDGANAALTEAVALVNAETDFPTRYLVCEALASADRYDDIVDLLSDFTSRRFDSPALRTLVGAAANGDRRAVLATVLRELPPEVANLRFYRRAKIAYAVRVGDVATAEWQIRAHLTEFPRDLEMHLRLLTTLFRQNKPIEIAREVARPASDFDGSPDNFIRLAQFKNDFGDWKEAHALAYKLLLQHPSNETVNLGYVGVFIHDRAPEDFILNPPQVVTDMAVGLSRAGQVSVYVIEDDPALRPGSSYVSSQHGLAQLFMGRVVGDEIELPDHSEATIAWIKPKELHALHVIMEEFNNLFRTQREWRRFGLIPTGRAASNQCWSECGCAMRPFRMLPINMTRDHSRLR